ncbi:poly(3-hydroxybutyrate) depolymerase [Flaviaesturariibacter amylovorans]|uniref:PHB depolymerase family esterase n=1 Tax=Flaviaesturariibacter amylovorans TaxID=1084520 RepID=A0ABP8HUD3_9BACT
MKQSLLFLLLLWTAAASAQRPMMSDSLLIGGRARSFHYFEPEGPSRGFHLVFVLHGSGGNGKGMMPPLARLEARASREKVLFVYPDGWGRYWNECRRYATSPANLQDVNEGAFFEALIDHFASRYGTVKDYAFAVGLSGGGHMAYKLAMTLPRRFPAISAIVANLPDPSNLDCTPSGTPVSVLITNGTADGVNPDGGGIMTINGASWGRVRSTWGSLDYWARLAGYKGKPVAAAVPDPDPANGQSVMRYTHRKGRRPEVTLLRVEGGDHAYPKDLDVFEESWAFFKRALQRMRK